MGAISTASEAMMWNCDNTKQTGESKGNRYFSTKHLPYLLKPIHRSAMPPPTAWALPFANANILHG
ncbi:Vitamin H transporter 1 [Alternaria alternata]|nr:Vitamin H transporter 1 [Alternaria alternata]